MNNLIIIVGHQGGGKSWKMRELLSGHKPDKTNVVSYSTFKEMSDPVLSNFEAVGVEEITSVNQLEIIIEKSKSCPAKLIACCQMGIDEIPESIVNQHEVLNMCRR
jgi:hypothetical protein